MARDQASGYIIQDGKVTGETVQCAHCQFTSERKPGSGRRRAYCTSCGNFTCGRPECARDQKKKMRDFDQSGCVPFALYDYLLSQKADKASQSLGKLGEGFDITEAGLIIPRTF